jgi:hypothetical protein
MIKIRGLWSEFSLGNLYTRARGNKLSKDLLIKNLSNFSSVGFSWLLDQVNLPPDILMSMSSYELIMALKVPK